MPFCPECGNKVSITDVRCSKCGTKLHDDTSKIIDIVGGNGGEEGSGKSHHNIEFALAIISVVLAVLEISVALNDYSSAYSLSIPLILIFLLFGVIGAIITRYYAKPGAIIVLISCFMLVLFGIQGMALALVFSVITVIVAFVLN